jgi:uridine phosphorylase
MPYFDVSPTDARGMFGIADDVRPTAAIMVGEFSQRDCFRRVRAIWPDACQVEEHSLLIEESGHRIWIGVVIGAAMAATIAHLVIKLGVRALVQVGAMGGLADGWQVGDILVPSLIVGRDGVSRRLSRNKPIEPEARLSSVLRGELASRLDFAAVRSGTLVSTTTISLERPSDVARWRRSGYVGVEMECAATIGMAAHFGVPAAGAFVLMDNLASQHTVLTLSEEDERRIEAGKDAILRASVAAISTLLAAPPAESPGRRGP